MNLATTVTAKRFTTRETKRAVPSNADGSGLVKWRADKIFSLMVHLPKAVKQKSQVRSSPFLPTIYDLLHSCSMQGWLAWVRAQHRR